ncbi:glutamate receptor 2-like [Neodiprion lecontei]|uniref:Glutamate receptor 2-like n=1 Tax=Neodiprion lecontei TaxID=441921 RepID=A0ABM3FUZ0_NEOLC|nr:glutamate receptor 2-like [Neodiprion lecontei]
MYRRNRSTDYTLFSLILLVFIIGNKFATVDSFNGVIWSDDKNDFVRIFDVPSFAKLHNEIIAKIRSTEAYNFNGTTLKLTAFPIKNLITFRNNNTVASGLHGDVWELIADTLNFKIRYTLISQREYGTQSKNGSWDGLIGYIYRNETDIIPRTVVFPSRTTALQFTLPMWMTGCESIKNNLANWSFSSYRLYIRTQLQHHNTWMIELFRPSLWMSTIALFFVLVFASFLQQTLTSGKIKGTKKADHTASCTLRDNFFYVFSMYCNQGWLPSLFERRAKILLLSTRLFSWLLIIAFSSKLISHVTQREFQTPFEDLESLYRDTNYKVAVKRNSFVYSVFVRSKIPIYKKIMNSNRLSPGIDLESYEKVCTGKYTYFEAQDEMEAKNSKLCDMTYVGKNYYNGWVAGGLVRGFKHTKAINTGVLRLLENGAIQRLKSIWLAPSSKLESNSSVSESIALHHLSLIFAMLLGATILSFVILLIEIAIYRYFNRRQIIIAGKRPPI